MWCGRRNRYRIDARLPLAEPGTREPAIGEVLALLPGQTNVAEWHVRYWASCGGSAPRYGLVHERGR